MAIGKIWKFRSWRIIWNCYFPKLGKMVAILCFASASIWVFSKWQNFTAALRLRLELSRLIFEWSHNLGVLMSYMSSLKCWNLYSFIPVWNLWCFLDLSAHPILPLTSSIFMYCNLSVHGEGCYLMITILCHYLHSQIGYLLIPVNCMFPRWLEATLDYPFTAS